MGDGLVILLKGGLTALDLFIDEMAIENDVEIINLSDAPNAIAKLYELDPVINENTTVVTFNNVGASLKSGEYSYWKMKNVKFANILVDHPVNYIRDIVNNYTENTYIYTIDEGHCRFLKDIFPGISEHFSFLPHGGTDINGICIEERPIDVLYVGGFEDETRINFSPIEFVDSEAFYEFCLDYYETKEQVEAQEAVYAFQKAYNLNLSTEQIIILTDALMPSVERFCIGERRKEMILALAMSGIHVTVAGGSEWESVANQNRDNIDYIGMVSPEKCLELITQAKILLNDSPYFASGTHERVFNGMINGAVVMTNCSKYLDDRFNEYEEILFWDMHDYDTYVKKVKDILGNETLRTQIAKNAYKVAKEDTWSTRLRTIVSAGEC